MQIVLRCCRILLNWSLKISSNLFNSFSFFFYFDKLVICSDRDLLEIPYRFPLFVPFSTSNRRRRKRREKDCDTFFSLATLRFLRRERESSSGYSHCILVDRKFMIGELSITDRFVPAWEHLELRACVNSREPEFKSKKEEKEKEDKLSCSKFHE